MSPHSPTRTRSLASSIMRTYPETHVPGSPSTSNQQPPIINHQPSANRPAFTLIELMVVIVIISILIALLLPAIGSIRSSARVAEVSTEIKGLESNITAFRTEFGIDPPSGITLYEAGDRGTSSADPSWGQDTAFPNRLVRSRTLIRRLWPQFDFSKYRDINGDGDMFDTSTGMHDPTATTANDTITMTGAECLVFFLGGVTATNVVNAQGNRVGTTAPDTQVTEWIPLGFSQNPRDPFERGEGTRVGPFHEFDITRLANNFSITGTGPGNDRWMPEYLDPLPNQRNPYLYVTSYDGKRYDPLDLGGPNLAPQPPYTDVTTMANVYLQKDDDPTTLDDSSEIPWKQSGFQIISPGFDGEYGLGGLYEDGKRFLDVDPDNYDARQDERDNITNFSSGMLED